MTKNEIIAALQNLNFVCVDDDAETKEAFERLDHRESFFAYHLGRKGYVSLRTYEQIQKHAVTENYDDFHLAAHYIMIDAIISHVATGIEVELALLIEDTLRCASDKNSRLIDALYGMISEQKAA